MSQRTTEIKRLHQPNTIVRDKQYYFNTLDLEHDLLKKAADIAERMMVAFMREHKVEVSVNVDDIADKIIKQLEGKLQSHVWSSPVRQHSDSTQATNGGFSYDDGPVIIKTDKVEVKGSAATTSKTKDSIKENLDILENLEI